MTDLSNLAQTVIDTILETREFSRYRELLEELEKQPDLFLRVNQMREKNFRLQHEENVDLLDMYDSLANEYEDVINNELVGAFMEAEVAACRVVKDFVYTVTKGLEFD